MKTKVTYTYRIVDLGCGCCSDSETYLEMTDKDGRWDEYHCRQLIENGEQLRQYLKEEHPELTDYEIVEEDCQWF